MITDRDLDFLFSLAVYYVLSRHQVQKLCFKTDKTGRVTRRRSDKLVKQGLINRHRAEVRYPNSAPAGSVYYPSEKGNQLLAEHTGDDAYLLTPTQRPQSHHIMHWLACSDTHITFDAAIEAQNRVQCERWINEWDICNIDETNPERRFRLYTLLEDHPRLVCAMDAAFLLSVTIAASTFLKVFYLEQDRGTTGALQVAARKHKGYAELAKRQCHRMHFPETNVDTFTVLCIAHTPGRRDALRRAFKGRDGSSLWKFASATELTVDSFLFAPVWYPVIGDPMPLVKLEQLDKTGLTS